MLSLEHLNGWYNGGYLGDAWRSGPNHNQTGLELVKVVVQLFQWVQTANMWLGSMKHIWIFFSRLVLKAPSVGFLLLEECFEWSLMLFFFALDAAFQLWSAQTLHFIVCGFLFSPELNLFNILASANNTNWSFIHITSYYIMSFRSQFPFSPDQDIALCQSITPGCRIWVKINLFLAVTWQLYRFPCHWVSHSLSHCHCW